MNNSKSNNIQEFKFKTDKIEKYFTFGILAIFLLSFTSQDKFWTILLFAITILVFIYYFLWYKKKNFYVTIENDLITIYPPLFFKPQEVKKQEIKRVNISDKKIEIGYNTEGMDKSINLYSILLQEDDWKQLSLILK